MTTGEKIALGGVVIATLTFLGMNKLIPWNRDIVDNLLSGREVRPCQTTAAKERGSSPFYSIPEGQKGFSLRCTNFPAGSEVEVSAYGSVKPGIAYSTGADQTRFRWGVPWVDNGKSIETYLTLIVGLVQQGSGGSVESNLGSFVSDNRHLTPTDNIISGRVKTRVPADGVLSLSLLVAFSKMWPTASTDVVFGDDFQVSVRKVD